MALGPGISYTDWVEKSGESSDIAFTLETGTAKITIDNLLTIRPREISRITPGAAVGGVKPVKFKLLATGYEDNNGNDGMTMGCISIINHNIPLGHPFRFTVLLKDFGDVTIYSNTSTNFTSSYRNAKFYHLFDQVYTEVKTAEISIEVAHDGTYQFDTDLDLGRLWVGNYLEACFESGYGFNHVGGGKEHLSIGNDSHINKKRPRQSMPFNFSLIPEDEVIYDDDNWFNLSNEVSTDSNILILPRVDDATIMQKLCIYGKLKRPADLKKSNGPYWNAGLDIIELA